MRCKNANRSGGSRHRGWADVNQAIEQELRRREVAFTGERDAEKGARARSSLPLYPLQYEIDCKRVAKQGLDEDVGVHKPRVKDKLKAAVAKAHEKNDVPQLEDKLALERVKRRKKKASRRAIRQYCDSLNANPKGIDPNSDQE